MIKRYAEDRKFKPPEKKPHNEGVLLCSNSKSCYDDDIESILESIKPQISGYEETIEIEPHGDGLDLMKEDSVEAEKHFLVNSLWLIHYECILDSDLQTDFRFCIKHSPLRTMILIWIDDPDDDPEDVEDEIVEIVDSDKIEVVKSKEVLVHLIRKYLNKDANPKMGKEGVIAWNNNVCDILDRRC